MMELLSESVESIVLTPDTESELDQASFSPEQVRQLLMYSYISLKAINKQEGRS